MPLQKSPTKDAFVSNLKKELGAGKPKDQALAIAYSVKRKAGGLREALGAKSEGKKR